MVYKYSAHCFSLEFESECLQRRKESLSVFVLDSEDKRRRQNRFDAKEWASKLAESDKPGSYYNQEKWLKDDKAPEPIETTAESSFTSSLASKASFLRRKVAKQEMKSREVQRHGNYKNRTKYCFESLL